MSGKLAKMSIGVSSEDRERFKAVASLMGMTLKDLVIVSVGEFISRRLNHAERVTVGATREILDEPDFFD